MDSKLTKTEIELYHYLRDLNNHKVVHDPYFYCKGDAAIKSLNYMKVKYLKALKSLEKKKIIKYNLKTYIYDLLK